jgi:hypothetical protein
VEQKYSGQQSNFVTVLAWLLIVFSGLASVSTLLQNIMVHTFLPFDGVPSATAEFEAMPRVFQLLVSHIQLVFVLLLALCVLSLGAAIGLLRRRNWARLVFVALFSLGILWTIGGLALQQFMMASLPEPPNASLDVQRQFDRMRSFTTIFGTVIGTTCSIVFGWLIFKLRSRPVREEFRASI